MVTRKKGCKRAVAFLGKLLTIWILVSLLGIVFPDTGVGQTPGYGEKPDQWAPYDSGRYLDRLQKIKETYRLLESKISYLHFEEADSPAQGRPVLQRRADRDLEFVLRVGIEEERPVADAEEEVLVLDPDGELNITGLDGVGL